MTRRVTAMLVLVLLCSAGARASNMAFSLRVQVAPGEQELRFLAVPWLHVYGTAEGLCTALGGSGAVVLSEGP